MKLNLGCGNEKIEGFINIDIIQTSSTDLVADCRSLKKFENSSVTEICSYHLVEHFTREEFLRAILEWWRILVPNGKLVLEFPNLLEILDIFISMTDQERYSSYNGGPALINHIYGGQNNPYEFHKFGFTKTFMETTLAPLFKDFVWGNGHKDYKIPCLSLTCIKK